MSSATLLTSEEIQKRRQTDYECLGRFIGLAELAKEKVMPQRDICARMIEILHEYQSAQCA